MIILGIILLVIGFFTGIGLLWTIGAILLVIGVILLLIGHVGGGTTVGGRRHWY